MSWSLAFRARTNIWMPVACAPNLTRLVGVILKVIHPSGPVAPSGGVVVVPNGRATTKTRAPWTEWLRLSETWKRAVNVRRDRSGCGRNCTRSMSRRLGSATSLIEGLSGHAGPAAILVGPEGGFDPDEQRALRACSYVKPLVLGPRILRAETAALAALACWQAVNGDWRRG